MSNSSHHSPGLDALVALDAEDDEGGAAAVVAVGEQRPESVVLLGKVGVGEAGEVDRFAPLQRPQQVVDGVGGALLVVRPHEAPHVAVVRSNAFDVAVVELVLRRLVLRQHLLSHHRDLILHFGHLRFELHDLVAISLITADGVARFQLNGILVRLSQRSSLQDAALSCTVDMLKQVLASITLKCRV